MVDRVCLVCSEEKPISEFHLVGHSKSGVEFRRKVCRKCRNLQVRNANKSSGSEKRYRKKYQDKLKKLRQTDRPRFILTSSRKFDRKNGLQNDLTKEFIEALIASGCIYCGNPDRMTADRIDNSLGHLQSNVVGACYRCNMLKRDMPQSAWILLVPALRTAQEMGAFGNWLGGRF